MRHKPLDSNRIAAINRLRLRINRRVDSLFVGGYRSAFRGSGIEFVDVRPYTPGDDIRRMDWKLTARERQPYVKVYKESRELTLILVVDVSASMRASGASRLAMEMAGVLACSAIQNGDRVGLIQFSDQLESWLPPATRSNHLWRVLNQLHDPLRNTSKGSRLDSASNAIFQYVPRRSTLCFLSDFLFPIDSKWSVLCRRHDVHGFLLHPRRSMLTHGDAFVDVVDSETGVSALMRLSELEEGSLEQRLTPLIQGGGSTTAVFIDEDPIVALGRHFSHHGRER